VNLDKQLQIILIKRFYTKENYILTLKEFHIGQGILHTLESIILTDQYKRLYICVCFLQNTLQFLLDHGVDFSYITIIDEVNHIDNATDFGKCWLLISPSLSGTSNC